MKIISDSRVSTGWFTAIIDGRWCQAKVYDEPSCYGINGGRVSKLSIAPGPKFTSMTALDYHYDRGLDFDRLPEGVLDDIVAQLEKLPEALG